MIAVIIAYCMLLHFVSDFLLQSREMGKKKSEDWTMLAKHVGITFGVFFAGLSLVSALFIVAIVHVSTGQLPRLDELSMALHTPLYLSLANAAIHGLIDRFIWRGYKASVLVRNAGKSLEELKEFKFYEDHWFYTTIGFDQLLHMLTIVGLVAAFFGGR